MRIPERWIGASTLLLCGALACNESPLRSDANALADAPIVRETAVDVPAASDRELGSRDSVRPADGAKAEGGAKSDSGAIAGLLLHVTFDQAPLGAYTDSAIKSEWKWIKWYQGLKEGRASIVEGAEAKQGRSLRILYPKGSVGPGEGGAQWMVTLPKGYDELYCSYWVKFGTGFDFVKGGKIPGLLGGAGNTGGNKPTGTDGWSARMMWQKLGAAVQYVYHPDQPTIYGESMPYNLGGQRSFKPGTWHLVEHRIVMNTPTKKDGVVQAWWEGQLVLDRKDIRFRDVSSFAIDGFYFSTFFGGDGATYAATKAEQVFFDEFIIATKPITH